MQKHQGSDARVDPPKNPAGFFWVNPPKKPSKKTHPKLNPILVSCATNSAIFYHV